MIVFSYKENLELFKWLFFYKIELPNNDLESDNIIKRIWFYLLSSEFLFIVASLLISVNFISIVRPMPIWWDDLWVYMNFPRQMVHSWDVTFLWWMYAWQIFTGIGYMISEPIQAFFLNNVWWVLSFIVIILVVSDLLKTSKNKIVNIPLLVATVFISMPMVVFQQAKDMKLDEGLFFFSLIVLYLTYKVYFLDYFSKKRTVIDNIKEKLHFYSNDNKKLYKFILILWILAWFSFAIKFTSLLLIVWIIWVFFYSILWWLWFLGYLFLFISIFTKFWLWKYMNIVYPSTDISLINIFSIFSFSVSILFFAASIKRYNYSDFKKVFIQVIIFILWIFIAISPWIYKNLTQSDWKISIWTILSGHQKSFKVDYNKIYTKVQLDKINKDYKHQWLNASWTTTNEDWWRYFGYEKWINNYVDLPWNLTMQVNQWWEFTTIWWLFLALLPGMLLFLPYRKERFDVFPILLIIFELLLFVIPDTREYFTNIMAQITLPIGYFVILAMFLIPTLYFLYAIKNTKFGILFKINLIFTSFYVFLWSIAAYWVVWYWIMMYFWLLLMIAIWYHYISTYDDKEDKNIIFVKFFSSLIVFSIFSVWFFMSVFPHSFNNLKNANYPYIKSWTFTPNELVFAYHPDYLKILFNLNIAWNKRNEFLDSVIKDDKLKTIVKSYYNNISTLNTVLTLIQKWQFSRILWNNIAGRLPQNIKNNLKKQALESRKAIFTWILNPKKQYQNNSWIYRIWTFLKYFIVWNDHRLYEDSLLTKFDKYFYSKNYDLVAERMKKFGLSYLLFDLNAATIDRDPNHALTTRVENLLKVLTSNKFKLIDTDSICLRYAREKYFDSLKTNKDLEKYVELASVNSESYINWKVVPRGTKLLNCYQEIIKTINKHKVTNKKYSYLVPIVNSLLANPKIANNQNKLVRFLEQKIKPGWKALFEIK